MKMPMALLAFAALMLMGLAATVVPDRLSVGAFSAADTSQDIPDGWERIAFSKIDTRTQYDLVVMDSTVVLRAQSDGGASGLVTRRRIDPNEYPVIEWRWRVNRVLDDGNARTKDGDDYPARLYITFDHDLGLGGRIKKTALRALGYDEIPSRALNYVWASQVEAGAVFPNAYTDWVMMMPVQSGPERCGEWVAHRRNIVADYRQAFGEDPPAITGIAIMTDTDNTGEHATAYYGDIAFRRASDQ